MRRLPNFTRTMVAVIALCVLIFAGMMYFVSGALARETMQLMEKEEALDALSDGLRLLDAYAAGEADGETLAAAAALPVNPAGISICLTGPDGALLTASEGADVAELTAYAAGAAETAETQREGERLLARQRGAHGAVAVLKPMQASSMAELDFRAMMLTYALLGLVFMGVALLLLALRIMSPVDELTSAARRISDGEQVEITRKLPVELRALGRAFNHMSHQLSSSMQQLTEERDTLSAVIESLDEGVLAVDRAGDILWENEAVSRLLDGRASAHYANVLRLLRDSEAHEPSTLQVGERTVVAVFRPLKSGAGALAVLRDVTQHERLERTRREYVANISHELRTPLSSMRGIAEGLRDGLVETEEERKRYYALILSEVMRLSRLVNDLLELSNLQSSPAAFDTEPVDTAELLYDALDRARSLAKKAGIELSLDAPEGLPQVVTNEDRVLQVLIILLDNAIKFTPAGGQVTLLAREEGRYVRFAVRDSGIGMDEYTVRHAFDRFHQADGSHGQKGSGLGLAIAREIMQRLDAHIAVKSKPGEGSEFSFLLACAE